MQVELFVVEEVHVLHHGIVVYKLTQVMLGRSQAELIDVDLLRLVVLHPIVESKRSLLELKSGVFWAHAYLTKGLNCE